MRNLKISPVAIAAALLFSLVAIYYLLVFIFLKPSVVEARLTRNIYEITQGDLTFKHFRFSSFPWLQTELLEPSLKLKGPSPYLLQAKKATLYFSFFDSLFGKIRVSKVLLEGGATVLKAERHSGIHIDQTDLRVSMRDPKIVRIRFATRIEESVKPVTGELVFRLDSSGKWGKKKGALEGTIELQAFQAATIFSLLGKKWPFEIQRGGVSGRLNIHKTAGSSQIVINAETRLNELIYQTRKEDRALISPTAGAQVNLEALWDLETREFEMNRGTIETNVGRLEVSGLWSSRKNEFKDLRFTATNVQLDVLPQYYLPLKEAIPFNLGFSGKSNIEMTVDGSPDHLEMHASWDLTPSLLTYGGQFAKPKDFPLGIIFDLSLIEGHIISGNFSLKLKDAVMKGTITKLDFDSGEGQLNVLTNKFELTGWEKLLPPFQNFKIDGQVKMLANLTGNLLRSPNQVKTMINIDLEQGSFLESDGSGLKNISVALDYGLLSFDVKNFYFDAGDSHVALDFSVTNLLHQPQANFHLVSPRLDAPFLVSSVKKIAEPWISEDHERQMDRLSDFLRTLIPSGEKLENFDGKVIVRNDQTQLQKIRFGLAGGQFGIEGSWRWDDQEPGYAIKFDIQQMDIERFYKPEGNIPVKGKTQLRGELRGVSFDPAHWKEQIGGRGHMEITEGSLDDVDLLSAVAAIPQLSSLTAGRPAGTPFKSLSGDYEIKEGKIMVRDLQINSSDLRAESGGEISFSGLFNFRLDIFLPLAKAGPLMAPWIEAPKTGGPFWLGGVPMLLSGNLSNPEIKLDASGLEEFQTKLTERKTHDLLRDFLA